MANEPTHHSRTSGIVERAKAIITDPREEWPVIAKETTPPGKVLAGYALPLIAIGPVAAFIGSQLFGMPTLFVTVRASLGSALTAMVVGFVLAIFGLYLISFLANFLSPKFGGRSDFPAAFRLVAYAMTASWIGGIFSLIPAIAILGLLATIYSIFLFYRGATPMLGVMRDKALGYTLLTVIAAFIVQLVIGAVVAIFTQPAILVSALDESAEAGVIAPAALPGSATEGMPGLIIPASH